MAMSHGIDPDVIPANALGRALGIFVLVISLVGLLLALWLGGLVVALLDLLTSLGLAARGASASPYPLGAWTLAIYLGGAAAGCFAGRHPLWAGLGLVALGAVAALYGGPITRVYGVLLLGAAVGLLAIAWRGRLAGAGVLRQ